MLFILDDAPLLYPTLLDIIYPVLKGNIYELSKDKKAVFIIGIGDKLKSRRSS